MKLLHFLYVVAIKAQTAIESYLLPGNISNNITKMQKLQKENEYLQKEINMLNEKTNINFEYCKLKSDDLRGTYLCKDDARVLIVII